MLSADFAAACGVATQSQSLYENDKRSPDADYLMSACALGSDPMFLLTGHRSPPNNLAAINDQLGRIVTIWPKVPEAARSALLTLLETLATGEQQ